MYQKTFIARDINDIKKIVDNFDLKGFYSNTVESFVQLYTTRIPEDDLKEMLSLISSAFPGIKTAGISLFGAREINNDPSVLLSFMFFHSGHLETFLYDFTEISEEEGSAELNRILRSGTHLKGVALYPAGYSIGISKIIEDVSEGLSHVPFFGSLASTHMDDFSRNVLPFAFTDDTVKYGLAVVAFYGEDLNIQIDACLGWKPLGKTFTAHVNDNIQMRVGDTCLEMLDDTPVKDLYKYYLDADIDGYNMMNINEFPIVLERDGIPYVRIPFFCGDNGEFYYYGDIKEGEKVQIGYGNPRELIRESELLSIRMQEFVPEAMFSFICVSRFMLLRDRYISEIDNLTRILPQATYAHGSGEIYKYNGYGGFLAGSIVAVAMREGPITDSMPRTNFQAGQEPRSNGLVPLSERLVTYLEKTSLDLNDMAIKADQANMAKTEFLSRMSHEIRTPINAIIGMNEMVLRESSDPQILEYAGNIANSGSMLLNIVNNILDFSKIEAGKMSPIPVDFDLFKLILDLVQIAQHYCEKKNLRFEVIVNDDMPYQLHFDEVMLKQIIANLISNAAKYTDKGTVTFSLDFEKIDDTSEYLTVHIKDTGIGVKPEDQKRMFIDFERFDEQNHRTTQGSGLGLSIVQRLLNMHDSKLEFVSEYGVGSDFYFTIKINVRDWATVASHKANYESEIIKNNHYHESFKAPGANVLVVDDVEVNRFVFKSLLKKTELNITEASGGQEALDLCKKNRYDLIFMDHLMPGLNGIETFHSIRDLDQDWTKTVPVIALTANAISGARNMYIEEGFIDYLSKPISPTYLESKLIQYLPKDKVQIVEKDDSATTSVKDVLHMNSASTNLDDLGSLPNIAGVDIIAGIKYCGDFITYQKALIGFVENIPKQLDKFNQYKSLEDLDGYILLVHSIKSTSRVIGANQLSRLAEVLEKAGKSSNFDLIEENMPVFVSGLSAIYEKLAPALKLFHEKETSVQSVSSGSSLTSPVSDQSNTGASVSDNNKAKESIDIITIKSGGESKDMSNDPIGRVGEIRKLNAEEMSKAFVVLKQKADEFDFDSCEKLVDFLTAQSVSNKMKTTLTEVKNALEDLDWDKVQSLIADF
ncbi:ATP-binding protein [Oribacterium sp. P6A1]|uniref:ATP-binding protein n=1 Tax=Oribacterium sp. P6A1 TaxID=1410612 RepID=UPI00068F0C70|nr:ATP-binding protein [Oribacterium sp. P6A1]